MKRLLLIVVAVAGCTSKAERAREVAAFKQSRDSLLTTEVVKSLQTPATIIYDPPTDLSYDSLLIKRPDLAKQSDRVKR